jgi:hypothetical protein
MHSLTFSFPQIGCSTCPVSMSRSDPACAGTAFSATSETAKLRCIQERAGQLVGAWFTLDSAGRSDDADSPHGFSVLGSPQSNDSGIAPLTIRRTQGGVFDAAPRQNNYRAGSAELVFASGDRAVLRYRLDANAGWAGD